MKSKMKNTSDVELLIVAATELATIGAALQALASSVRGVMHGPVLDRVFDQMSEASMAARKRTLALTAEIHEQVSADRVGPVDESLSLAGADELATRLVELAKRLLAADATKVVDASPTRQEAARAPITEPVRVVVRQDFGRPVWDLVEDAMKEAGIPGRIGRRGDIEIKHGYIAVEESAMTGEIAITWYPAGR